MSSEESQPFRVDVPQADLDDLVVPTLPGFGFSGATRDEGWTVPR